MPVPRVGCARTLHVRAVAGAVRGRLQLNRPIAFACGGQRRPVRVPAAAGKPIARSDVPGGKQHGGRTVRAACSDCVRLAALAVCDGQEAPFPVSDAGQLRRLGKWRLTGSARCTGPEGRRRAELCTGEREPNVHGRVPRAAHLTRIRTILPGCQSGITGLAQSAPRRLDRRQWQRLHCASRAHGQRKMGGEAAARW